MSKLDTLEPAMKDIVVKVLDELKELTGMEWIVVSARRTIAEQNELYTHGRDGDKRPIVTKAKGGQSPHNFGLAVDLCPYKGSSLWWDAPDDVWQMMAKTAEKYGLSAGYNFKSFQDKPHIEARNWKAAQLAWRMGKLEVA